MNWSNWALTHIKKTHYFLQMNMWRASILVWKEYVLGCVPFLAFFILKANGELLNILVLLKTAWAQTDLSKKDFGSVGFITRCYNLGCLVHKSRITNIWIAHKFLANFTSGKVHGHREKIQITLSILDQILPKAMNCSIHNSEWIARLFQNILWTNQPIFWKLCSVFCEKISIKHSFEWIGII